MLLCVLALPSEKTAGRRPEKDRGTDRRTVEPVWGQLVSLKSHFSTYLHGT